MYLAGLAGSSISQRVRIRAIPGWAIISSVRWETQRLVTVNYAPGRTRGNHYAWPARIAQRFGTLQRKLVCAWKTVTDLQSQYQTVRFEAEVEKLRAMKHMRQQGDKEWHLCAWIRTGSGTGLLSRMTKRECEPGRMSGWGPAGSNFWTWVPLLLHKMADDHSVDDFLPVGSQPVEDAGKSASSPPPVISAEEQTVSAPIVGWLASEWPHWW